MSYKRPRSLHVETLENRRVLSAGPITSDVQLVSFDPATGAITTSQNSQSEAVNTNRHPAARNGVLLPFLTGDFNDDGITDLLAADSTDNSWWLQLNDGTQLFELPVGQGLTSVQQLGTADFNQDQRLDVASINTATNELWISLNTPDGFTHQSWGSFPAAVSFSELHIGDFNGDGLADILSGETDGAWRLAANQDGSTFDVQDWGLFPDFAWTKVLSGNFNADALADIVALAPDNTWWIWQGTPAGFGAAQNFGHWKMGSGWKDIGAADFNNDGIDDVIGRTPDGKLHVGTSTPTGFNTWIWGSGWIDSADWSQVSIRDLNGDDLPDQISQAKDGTWWYAINNGGSFQNFFWQRAENVDFILENFAFPGIDTIDSMPDGGVDVRKLVVSAVLNAQNEFLIQSSGPIQVEGMTFTSDSGSLLLPANGGTTLPGSSSFAVSYGSIDPRLSGTPLAIGLGWDPSGLPDLSASVQIGGSVFPIQVPLNVGPAVGSTGVTDPVANEIYFSTLPPAEFLPEFVVGETRDDATANTISFADAKLRVERNEKNRIVLSPVEPLMLTGVELRSKSGSLIPIGDGGINEPADPFLSFLVNSPTRIIFSSETWPLLLSDSLVTDVGWRPNSTASDLIVEYRVAGDDTVQVAHVAEPLRLPFVDPAFDATTGTFGPVRFAQ